MSIHSDFRRLGLGKALLQKLIAMTKEIEGLLLLELNVMAPNIAAIELYKK
jgi:ribosomal protein S18 acetylase RimI-like enzyme